jgi:CheY-like chemotaxis protein
MIVSIASDWGRIINSRRHAINFMGGPVKKKILVVDDWQRSREAKNSSDAIALAGDEGPDLIFMDRELPDLDGVETTTVIRQNPKISHIPVVALTAWISELWQKKAARVGIVTYLMKPVAAHTLKQTIEEYLNGSVPTARL